MIAVALFTNKTLLFHSCAILPNKVKRTRKIFHGIVLQNLGFSGFLAERTGKTKFCLGFFEWNNKPLFDGLIYNTSNEQNVRAYYMLSHRIRCMYFVFQ